MASLLDKTAALNEHLVQLLASQNDANVIENASELLNT
jgi:hypothetical protein